MSQDTRQQFEDFTFLDVGLLEDSDLLVKLDHTVAGASHRLWLPSYHFRLYLRGHDFCIGKIDLRIGMTNNVKLYGGNIGYSVEAAYRGHHYAEKACRLLLPIAQKHGMRELWITCNPDNWPSRRTCERLGAEMVEIISLPNDHEMYLEGDREKCRYCLKL